MSYSASRKSFLYELASWVAAALILAVGLAKFDELKQLALQQAGVENGKSAGHIALADTESDAGHDNSPYTVELSARRNGHFVTEADINGHTTEVMVDTGASFVALPYKDAEEVGIYLDDSDFAYRVSTANGVARVAKVKLDEVNIGGISVRDVDAVVSEPGRLGVTLLGMSFLGRLEAVELKSGKLVLKN